MTKTTQNAMCAGEDSDQSVHQGLHCADVKADQSSLGAQVILLVLSCD